MDRRYQASEISYHTWYNYHSMIRSFRLFYGTTLKKKSLALKHMDAEILQQYKSFCLQKGNSTDTVNRKLVPLLISMKYAEIEGLVSHSTFVAMEALYLPARSRNYGLEAQRKGYSDIEPIHHLNDLQLKQLLGYYEDCGEKSPFRIVLDLFFFSFHACGLRISDILTLEWKSIDFANARLSKVLVKSKAMITIPLTEPAIHILYRWKKINGKRQFVFGFLPDGFDLTDEAVLARTIDNRNKTIRNTLNTIGNHLNFPIPLGMHVARHSFAVRALNTQGISVHMISRLLGHSSVLVTEKVYARFLLPTLTSEVREKLSSAAFLP